MARAVRADLILAIEVNEAWERHLEELREEYPYVVSHPQNNHYGMMLLSRLELKAPEVRTIVQEDVPSIHTGVQLRSGEVVYFHGVHPRPPQPAKDQHTTSRDAELVLLAREIDECENERPTIIAGDFNDVAWSHTTKLFVRLSELLDPRRGRGIFNTFPVQPRLLRVPLDHVFHSGEFRLNNLKVLQDVGSDHFPVFSDLQYAPRASTEAPQPTSTTEDEVEATDKIERVADEPTMDTGDDTAPECGEGKQDAWELPH
jgi:endonuclease/exonuclease/phosphatase (EEP) superfamily protein YafD